MLLKYLPRRKRAPDEEITCQLLRKRLSNIHMEKDTSDAERAQVCDSDRETFIPHAHPPQTPMAGQELFNMVKAQGYKEHLQQKKIQDLTQHVNQKNAELHQMNIHSQQSRHTIESYAQRCQHLEQSIAAYEQNRVTSDLQSYKDLERRLIAREEWQRTSISKIEDFCLQYAPTLEALADFLSFYENVRKSIPPERFSAIGDWIDQHAQSVHDSRGHDATDHGVREAQPYEHVGRNCDQVLNECVPAGNSQVLKPAELDGTDERKRGRQTDMHGEQDMEHVRSLRYVRRRRGN